MPRKAHHRPIDPKYELDQNLFGKLKADKAKTEKPKEIPAPEIIFEGWKKGRKN
jgi:hypothetical protein